MKQLPLERIIINVIIENKILICIHNMVIENGSFLFYGSVHVSLSTKNHIFFGKWFNRNIHWDIIFFVLVGKMEFLFPENISFFAWKTRNDLPKKVHRNMKAQLVVPFSVNMILVLLRKLKMIFP